MVTTVKQFIIDYPVSRFITLSSEQQLDELQKAFPNRKRNSLKVSKSRFFSDLNGKQCKINTPKPHPDQSVSSAPDDPRKGGGSLKLTEDLIETAIARVLLENPEKGLSAAISWMDKKKAISVEDEDTKQALVGREKLTKKHEEMFR